MGTLSFSHAQVSRFDHHAALRIQTSSNNNSNFFRPSLRSGLKQRQEASVRQRLQHRQREWEAWEQQVAEEERQRRGNASKGVPNRRQARHSPGVYTPATDQAQRAVRESDEARQQKERQLDDIQRRLQERVRDRQRRADRWMPPEYADVVAQRAVRAAEERDRAAAAREARLRQEEERASRAAADAAVAAQFLQGRVRQKVSRFAEVVDSVKERHDSIDPYRGRREDAEYDSSAAAEQRRRQRQQQQEPRRGGGRTEDAAYYPPDVIRVSRDPSGSSSRRGSGMTWSPEQQRQDAEWQQRQRPDGGGSRRDADGEYIDW